MKIIGTADLHAHNYKEFDKRTEESGSRRLDNTLKVLKQMTEYALIYDIECIFIAGDVFHIRNGVNTSVYNGVYDMVNYISSKGITLVMIPGNHDDSSAVDLSPHSLHSFKHIPNVYVLDSLFQQHTFTDSKGESVNFVGLRYTKDANLVTEMASKLEVPTGDNVLLAHLGIAGGLMGSGHSMPEGYHIKDLRPDLFNFMAFGHFHRRQFLNEERTAFYCGSPIQHDFGEEGNESGFVELDTKSNKVEWILTDTPRFYTVDLSNHTDLSTKDDIVELINMSNGINYFRFKVSESILKELVSLLSSYPNVSYKLEVIKEYKAEERVDVKIGMPFEEIVSKYAEEFNPEAKQEGIDILREVRGI